MLRPPLYVHSPQAHADGTRGDDDHLVPFFAQLYCHLNYKSENGQAGFMALLVHNGAGPCPSCESLTVRVNTHICRAAVLTQLYHNPQ